MKLKPPDSKAFFVRYFPLLAITMIGLSACGGSVEANKNINASYPNPTTVESVENLSEPFLKANYITLPSNNYTYMVEQQPVGNPGFVSHNEETVTQFEIAFPNGKGIGLLAHNYLLGKEFFNLKIGEIIIIYTDSHELSFTVIDTRSLQALSPYDPSSEFLDLETQEKISAEKLFTQVYKNSDRSKLVLTLQTCIEAEGNSSWGRYFVFGEER